MNTLSEAARVALVNAGTNRQGAVVQALPGVLAELEVAGMIGVKDGLTRSGTIARERIVTAMLDAAF